MGTSSPAIRRLSAAPHRNWTLAALLALAAGLAATFAIQRIAAPSAGVPAPASVLSPQAKLTLPAAAAATVSARLGRDLPAYRFASTAPSGGRDGSFRASTPSQRLTSRFSAAGVEIRTGSSHLDITVMRLDGSALSPHAAPTLRSGRVSYRYAGASAWYANGPLGLEQGFTVTRRAAHTTVALTTLGLHPRLTRTGVTFGTALRYDNLRAVDARGHRLAAHISLIHGTVVLSVDTAGAHFPVTIDPLVQSATLEPSDTTNLDDFGESVAVAGDTLVVGDPNQNGNGPAEAAYVFKQGTDGWSDAVQVATLTAENPNQNFVLDGVGDSIAITPNGQAIAVGAPDTTDGGTAVGAVLMYQPGANGWTSATQSATIIDPNATADAAFGEALSLSDDMLAVGAPGLGSNSGEAFLYDEPGAGWTGNIKSATDFAGSGGEGLGTSVALSADDSTLALGAPIAAVNGDDNVGQVALLLKPAGGWGSTTPTTYALTPSDPNPPSQRSAAGNDQLGTSVAISADGSTVAAGAPGQDEPDAADEGAVDVFTKPQGGWVDGTQASELYDASGDNGDQLGDAVAFAGSSVIAGDGSYGDGAGALFEFDAPVGGWASQPTLTDADPTFTGANNTSFAASVAADGDTVVAGQPGADNFVGAADVYDYSAPASTPTTPSTTTLAPPPSTGSASPPPATPAATPATIDFAITPAAEPVLTGQTLTFTASAPEAGVDYAWSFDDHGTADGSSVTHTYTGAGVFTITLTESINGTSVGTASHNVIVVQAQAPNSDFTVVRTSQQGGNGASNAVTDPVAIVPAATLPEVDATAQDQLTKLDYWFNAADVGKGTPDLTCLPDGACGHYSGTSNTPTDADLTPVPGVTVLGRTALWADGSTTEPAGCKILPVVRVGRPDPNPACARYTPTAGFPSIQINFWDAALAQIGDGVNSWASTPEIPVGPEREAVASDNSSGRVVVTQPTETVPYPSFDQLNRAQADGYQGEQGVPDTGCFPGDDYKSGDCQVDATTWQSGPPAEAGGQEINNLFSTIFGPFDLAHYGVNSPQQLEDQWNLLYNYATVVGVDTPLDDQFGPATGATEGSGNTTVPRTVTMVAYNAEGIPSSQATEQVPLTPAATPSFSVCVEDVSGNTPCVIAPKTGPLPFTIDTGDTLKFVVNGSGGGDAPITQYAIAVGQPNTAKVDTAVGTLDQCGAPTEIGSWMSTESSAPTSTSTEPETGGSSSSSGTSHPITAKSAPTGPQRRSEIRRAGGGLSTSATTIPPFSDLMAGAFAPHDCEGYSERTVNAAGTPGAPPATGPTVTLHAATSFDRAKIKTPIGPEPVVGGNLYTNLGVATTPTVTTPAPTVATGDPQKAKQAPILITSDANKLDFAFGKVGTYSASIAAYNSAGLGAITRIDGFLAQASNPYGFCTSVEHQSFAIPVRNAHGTVTGYRDLGFSGNCMTVIAHNGNDQLYASTQPIDLNGVPVAPSPGDSIVISTDQDTFYVAKCPITTSELTEKIGGSGGHPNPCPDTNTGDLYLALGAGKQSNGQVLPGFARLTDLTTDEADAKLLPLTTQGLPVVGAAPAKGSALAEEDVKDCGLYQASETWPNAPGATYDGFGIASTQGACVAFTTKGGAARVAFWDSLPMGFSNNASAKPDSDQVVLYGSDLPAVSNLSDNPYATVASVQRLPKPVIAGTFPTVPTLSKGDVRTADDLPGFPAIPTCPPDTNGKSGLSIPDNTDLGPITMPVGASFCYIAKTGDFIGNVMVDIPGPLPINSVEVGFEIGHGHLIDAGGELSGNVPIFPGVFINDFKFDVKTDPTEVAAAITASIIDLLDIQGGVIVKPSLPEVDFEGQVSIAGVTFGNFDMDFTKQGLGMDVSFGKDFGPASLNISVSGALSTSPASFYMEGTGNACLFICLPVGGLISNQGLAACGTINLLLVDFTGGFAVMWTGPNSGVHLFTGCDLQPYIPANLANIKGAIRSAEPSPALATERASALRTDHDDSAPQQQVLAPGGSEQLPLHQPTMCPDTFVPPTSAAPGTVFTPPAVPADCSTQTEAIQIHSLYDPSDPGATPLVSLTNASGDTRVPQTPTTPGYWGLDSTSALSGGAETADDQTDESTALVDQNPVPTDDEVTNSSAYCPTTATSTATTLPANCPKVVTTTIYIGDPGPGNWTLNVLPSSAPVVDVTTADETPTVTPSMLGDRVLTPTLTAGRGDAYSVKIGRTTYASSAIAAGHLLLAPSIEAPATTAAAQERLARIPAASDLDVSPINAKLLRSITLKLPANFAGTASIIDTGRGCVSTCSQVLASNLTSSTIPTGGLPVLFNPITAGTTQKISAFIANSAGMPSKVIPLVSFRSPRPPRPTAPILERLVRDGSVVHAYVNVTNTPVTGSISLALSASNGAQYDQTFEFDNGSMTPVDTSPMTGVGAARHHTIWEITVPDVDPTASLHVALAGLNDGVLGASSHPRAIKPLVLGITDKQLLTKLHVKL